MVTCCLAPWWLTTSRIPNYYRSPVGNMNMPINLYIYIYLFIYIYYSTINHQWQSNDPWLQGSTYQASKCTGAMKSASVTWKTETYVISRGPSPVAKISLDSLDMFNVKLEAFSLGIKFEDFPVARCCRW